MEYLRYTSVIPRRKVVDHFCEFSLRDNDFFVWVRDTYFCVYVEGRKVGRKRIILVDYLLQIHISCLCRLLPPNSFQALQ